MSDWPAQLHTHLVWFLKGIGRREYAQWGKQCRFCEPNCRPARRRFTTYEIAINAVANVIAHSRTPPWLGARWAEKGPIDGWETVVNNPYDLMSTGPTGLPDSVGAEQYFTVFWDLKEWLLRACWSANSASES